MVDNSQFFDAVFFDMDGLMVDSEPEWFKSETEVTAKFGYKWSEEDQIACLGGPLTRVGKYMHDKCKGAETPEYFTQTLIDTFLCALKNFHSTFGTASINQNTRSLIEKSK